MFLVISVAMRRTERLFAIAELLRARRTGIKAQDLAARFGVTVRTIYRDLDGLRAAAVPVIHRRGPWRSFEAVEYATLEGVDWFNSHRLLGPIGNIPPAEAEANHYAASEDLDMAA